MRIIALTEGNFIVNEEDEFKKIHSTDCIAGIRLAVRPFLVIVEEEYILLDTGLGTESNGKSKLLSLLEQEDVLPDRITKILLSHLHKDHTGGLFSITEAGYRPNFANAQIYLQQRELEFALSQKGNTHYDRGIVDNIYKLPNLVLLNKDSGQITHNISYQVSGGHSPFHQEFFIRTDGRTIFYGADNLPQHHYFNRTVVIKNDHNGYNAAGLRKIWKDLANKERWILLYYHDLEKKSFDIAEYL